MSMVDEVIDGLGNMKLMFEDEEVIPISDEGRGHRKLQFESFWEIPHMQTIQ